MKFVCLNCETYMNFEKVEKPGEGSLGVFFGCPSCQAKFSMVTNPGETQMVASLGVKLGGRSAAAEPFEMTRGTLKDEAMAGSGEMAAYLNEKIQGGQPAAAAAHSGPASHHPVQGTAKEGEKTSGCPFSAMVAEMGLTTSGKPQNGGGQPEFTWTPDAREKLDRLPSFVKPMVQGSVEAFARKQGYKNITLQVMDDSKNDSSNGVAWTQDAEHRLDNIPDFIRPMARREIERLAKERGVSTITAEVMDEAKRQVHEVHVKIDDMDKMGARPIRGAGWAFRLYRVCCLSILHTWQREIWWVCLVLCLVLLLAAGTMYVSLQVVSASEYYTSVHDHHSRGSSAPTWEGSPQGIAYSEFNHHLAGAFLLLIGLTEFKQIWGLPFLLWTRFFLPVGLLGAGVFLLIWSDHDAWPIGSLTFTQTFMGHDSEILQHKAFGVLSLGVGITELLRRLGRIEGRRWTVPLPLFAALGGLMLLVICMEHTPLLIRYKFIIRSWGFWRSWLVRRSLSLVRLRGSRSTNTYSE